jgi:hypothetical protein
MTILKQLTSIVDLKSSMESGIVCLTDTNEKNEIRHSYVTTSIDLLDFFEFESEELDNEDDSVEADDHFTLAYDILENEVVSLQLAIYTGFAHEIASIYLPGDKAGRELLKLQNKNFLGEDSDPATLMSVLDTEQEHNLVFSSQGPGGQVIHQVNEYGEDFNESTVIFNDNKRNTVERDGHLLISKKHNPVFITEDKVDNVKLVGKCKLLLATGFVDNLESLKSITLRLV